jgi:hypothetical protein
MKLLFVQLWHLWFWRRFLKIKLFLAVFHFQVPVRKLFGISEPYEQISKRTTQGTSLPKISSIGVVVSEKKMFKEKLTRTRTQGHDIRSE